MDPPPTCSGVLLGLLVHKFIGSDKLMDKQTHKTVEAGIEKHHVKSHELSMASVCVWWNAEWLIAQ